MKWLSCYRNPASQEYLHHLSELTLSLDGEMLVIRTDALWGGKNLFSYYFCKNLSADRSLCLQVKGSGEKNFRCDAAVNQIQKPWDEESLQSIGGEGG